MPNKHYEKGRRKEYKVVNMMREKGYLAQRTAGSHSPFDVIAINPDIQDIRLIQVKPDSMPESEKEKIEEKNKKLNGLFEVEFIVI